MGSPTSDDDPTRRVEGPGGWGPPGPGGPQYPGPSSPPPGQGAAYPPPGQGTAFPPPDSPTTRFPPPPEQQRGQTAQFPAVGPGYQPGPGGPYPPQGPPGPYGYGPPPGGPPPGGGRSRRGLVIALVIGLVALVVLGAALVFAFTRDDGKTVSAAPSTATSAAPTSSSSEPSPTESASSSSPSPSEAGADRTDELLAAVPADFTDCAGADPAGDGDVAAVDCGASTTQPGPTAASFYLYDDTDTLDQVFTRDAGDIGAMPEGEDCATAEGVTVWNADGVEGGQIACTITDEGLLIAWTDREFGIEAVVTGPGSTQDELAELAEWWRNNSDLQG